MSPHRCRVPSRRNRANRCRAVRCCSPMCLPTILTYILRPYPRVAPNPSGGYGLKAEYYNNATWSGNPTQTKVDSSIDFDWGTKGPVGIGNDNFSVKWTGDITIGDKDAKLTFFSDDAVIVYLDGKKVIDGSDVYDTFLSTEVLKANSKHSIEVRYAEFGGNACIYVL